MGIEALPYSYLAGWIGMLIAEVPLLVKNYRGMKQESAETESAESGAA
jgi:hypothetical protein